MVRAWLCEIDKPVINPGEQDGSRVTSWDWQNLSLVVRTRLLTIDSSHWVLLTIDSCHWDYWPAIRVIEIIDRRFVSLRLLPIDSCHWDYWPAIRLIEFINHRLYEIELINQQTDQVEISLKRLDLEQSPLGEQCYKEKIYWSTTRLPIREFFIFHLCQDPKNAHEDRVCVTATARTVGWLCGSKTTKSRHPRQLRAFGMPSNAAQLQC